MTLDAATQKRKRKSGPKARSGCNTCRIRHVKCDEHKPSCLRCLNYSGICSGYSRSILEVAVEPTSRRRLMPKAQDKQISISSQPKAAIFADEKGRSFYHLFVAKTADRLSGFFDNELWSRIILQACQSEPSIRHAVVAIGALDMTMMVVRDLESRHGDASSERDEAVTKHHQFALQQYSKAITAMREAVALGNQPLRTTLLASMLTICFEMYHGDHLSALAQMRVGLGLLAMVYRSKFYGSGPMSSGPETIEDEICEAFDRLDTQVMTLPDPRPASDHKEMMNCHKDDIASMPKEFHSIKVANFYSTVLLRRLMHFRIFHADTHQDTMAQAVGLNEIIADPPEEMTLELARYIADLESWRSAFSPLMERLVKSGNEREYLCGVSLDIQNLNSISSLEGTLGKDQTRFDRFLPQYKAIVSKSRVLLTALQKNSTNFIFDFQCIMPLYVTGRKCRDPVVRREAISLLLGRSWREGVWDSILAGKIAKWVMEIEEEGIGDDGFVPEWSRVRGAEVGFDLRERSARIRCLRRRSENCEEMKVREVQITW